MWFGLIGLFATFAIVSTATKSYLGPNDAPSNPARNGAKSKTIPPIIVLLPLSFMAGVGFILMRSLLWDLVDEVIDTGDAFIVRKGKLQERIPISNVINVSFQSYTNPPRLTLTLKQPGVFGKEFSFIIQQQRAIFSVKRNPLVDELIERVDAARRSLPPGAI